MKLIQLLITLSAAISVICHLAIQVVGSLRLRAVSDKIGGTVKSRADLDEVKAAIQLNLYLGVPVVCNAPIMLVLLSAASRWVWISCIAALIVGQVFLWIIFRPMEKRFKVLTVADDKPELHAEYRSYVEQWSGFTLVLKSPKTKE